jgi:YggT family protein
VVLVLSVIKLALFLFLITLFARFVLDMIRMFARDWRPSGVLLVLAVAVYAVTDPPVRLFRRLIPPLRLGQISLDLGFTVLLFVALIAYSLI